MKNNNIKMNVSEFIDKYYNERLEEKYGDDWMDVVIDELRDKENTIIEFVYE